MKRLMTRAATLAALCSLAASGTALAGGPIEGENPGCEIYPEFTDGAGEYWEIDRYDGNVTDDSDDSYDGYGYAGIYDHVDDNDGDSYWLEEPVCAPDDGGDEVVFPVDRLAYNQGDQRIEIDMQRKVYVPAQGQGFARWLDILVNPADEPVTIGYWWSGDYGDDAYGRVMTASGDETIDEGERWSAFQLDDGDTHVSSLWDGEGAADRWDAAWDLPNEENRYVGLQYKAVTIPAGGKAVFMHVEHQNSDDTWSDEYLRGAPTAAFDEVVDFARRNEAGNEELFARMTDDEKRSLRNWNADLDRDGVIAPDNCDRDVNPNQSDVDRDGLGDACDEDIDGDGLTNAQEQRLGTNPASADSDGDGNFDGVDRCPTRSGTADGCPVAVAASQNSVVLPRLRAQRLTADLTRKRVGAGLRMTTSGKLLLPKGVSKAAGCQGVVLVTTKAGKLTVSSRRVRLNDDCTYSTTVRFNNRSRFGGRALTVQATFQGNARIFRQRAKKLSAGRA